MKYKNWSEILALFLAFFGSDSALGCTSEVEQIKEVEMAIKHQLMFVVSYGVLPILDRHNPNFRALSDGLDFVFFIPNVYADSKFYCVDDDYYPGGEGVVSVGKSCKICEQMLEGVKKIDEFSVNGVTLLLGLESDNYTFLSVSDSEKVVFKDKNRKYIEYLFATAKTNLLKNEKK